VSDQVAHPYKTTGKIIVIYILIPLFLDSKLEDRDSALHDSKHSQTLVCSSFLPEWNFYSLRLFPNIGTVPPFQRIYYQFLYFDFVLHSDIKT